MYVMYIPIRGETQINISYLILSMLRCHPQGPVSMLYNSMVKLQDIMLGDSKVVLTTGSDNMSAIPYMLNGSSRFGLKLGMDLKVGDDVNLPKNRYHSHNFTAFVCNYSREFVLVI